MIDIVIPLGKGGQKHGDIELKYALRSIEKYLTGYRYVFIVGEFPEWGYGYEMIKNWRGVQENGGLQIVDALDIPGRKQCSLFKKLMAVCNDYRISEDFIYWHDDHFLLRPLNVSQIENWWNWTLETEVSKAVGTYKESVKNTIGVVAGASPKNYDIHVPCIFNKDNLRILDVAYDWGRKEYGYIIKSLYFNQFGKENDPQMEDKKFRVSQTKEKIYEQIDGRLFFSLAHSALKENMKEVLQELYPEKSTYES